jgi:CIC family chloride channel protein
MVIGAFIGAAVWRLLDPVVPSLGHDPAPYVIVGMMACFGSISRAPLAVMLMVAEMTGSLSLIVPAMVAVGLATLIVRRNDDTIYRSQLRSRAESPAHRILTGLPLLAMATAAQAMAPAQCLLFEPGESATFLIEMTQADVNAAPLIDAKGHYVGVITKESLEKHSSHARDVDIESLVEPTFAPINQSVHLDIVLDTLTSTPQTWAAVIDDERRVLGTIAISDIVRNYRRTMQANVRRIAELSGSTGISEFTVTRDSPLVNVSLKSTLIPRGALITGIERGRDVIRPTGATIIKSGDRLMALGGSDDLDSLGQLASSH